MKPTIGLRQVPRAGLAMCILACGMLPAHADEGCHDLGQVAFMLGDWQVETEGTVFDESWSRNEDGTLSGRASSHKSGSDEILQREVMSLVLAGGVPAYVVDVGVDGNEVTFLMVDCEGQSARFENPDHDFPQRLFYQLRDDGTLRASVTDLDDNGFDLDFAPAGEGD